MIAMNRARHRDCFLVGLHELQHRHLRRGILHGHAVGTQRQHGLAAVPGLRLPIVDMRDEDLFGQRQRATELLSRALDRRRHGGIQFVNKFK